MKGYKFIIWLKTVVGDWNTNIPTITIHARNLKEAWEKFEREYPEITDNDDYWIYKVVCLGRVRKVVTVSWKYIPLVKPRYESRY